MYYLSNQQIIKLNYILKAFKENVEVVACAKVAATMSGVARKFIRQPPGNYPEDLSNLLATT